MDRAIRISFMALMLISGNAMACDSYEECMEEPAKWSYEEKTAYATRAIAYKLDEISKKLEKEPNHRSENVFIVKANGKVAWYDYLPQDYMGPDERYATEDEIKDYLNSKHSAKENINA